MSSSAVYSARWRAKNPGYAAIKAAEWNAAHPGYKAARLRELHALRTSMLRIIKQEMGCIDCGYSANPVALDFDHLRDKLFGISTRTMRNINDIQAELAKCVVRCANCHRIRTQERTNAG